MSFASDINTVLQGNTPLNNAVGSRIYSYNLPDNLDVELTAIVFNYKKDSGVHTIQEKNVLENYVLYVAILSQDPEENETVASLVRAFLDNYSDSRIREVVFEEDTNGIDQDKERYFKMLSYNVIYQN